MTGLNLPALETLRAENLQQLASSSSGPCITMFLQAYRPGAQTKSMADTVSVYCQEAKRQLAARGIPASQISDLLDPVERLRENSEFTGGSHLDRAIFRSRETFLQLDGVNFPQPGLTVGGCFHIRPILMEFRLLPEFYVLKLSQKEVDLLRCAHFCAEAVNLPKGVPRTLDEALEFRPPDHDLENRSPAGSSLGSMRRVRFGTGVERENALVHVADFFKAVDRGLRELPHSDEAPLVLAGVQEDTAIYQSVSVYRNLLKESIAGSANTPFSNDDLLQRAYGIIRADLIDRASASLRESKERMAPARFSTDLDVILRAAVDGRIASLFINEGVRAFGAFDVVRRGGRVNWGEEDLLNVAAIETISQRGDVYSLPGANMPDGTAVAAVFRY